ncbi:MAG: chemotaxis protein CheW [Sulfurimonadaceae bacterium]|jgi:two-component system chemotaxis response regulator CheV|nr:chemotaxis protein CheW [Sulfurimonadaceae bacterium]
MATYKELEDITTYQNDQDDIEDDDLDLIKLVSTNANDTSQYLIFVGSDDQYYAKNVSKIEELLVYKDLSIVKNNNNGLILGTADIRGNMTSIVSFDRWYGNKVLDDSEYELVVLAHYGGHRMGIVVKRVEYIVNIPADTMTDNSENNEKSSFITKVQIGRKQQLCIIFDSDKMLLDVFDKVNKENDTYTKQFKPLKATSKRIIFADDSRFIRNMVQELFISLGVNYNMYEDGKELIDALATIPPEEIGLFITDLEMPVMGGKEVVKYIKEHHEYDGIKVVVHTNMSNDVMETELMKFGVDAIIGKVNMLKLGESIQKLML